MIMESSTSGSITTSRDIKTELQDKKYSIISADQFSLNHELIAARQSLWHDWSNLASDNYLKNNARFRLRRFANFYFRPDTELILDFPPTTYFQSTELNSYAGGIQRKLGHLQESTLQIPFCMN
ncbi:hypothetical protein A9Q98_09275 [Thalassotalea sp. 42_200_T64]|nr:hypothetical protein A9Q98_09275 [Thalassotalea sp. 42_200_T64]